jgi:hypothetical protein
MSLCINRIDKYGRFMITLGIVAVAITSAGCATIVTGGKRQVTFESDPPGATVRAEGAVLGKTPFTATVKGAPVVEFCKDGYQTRFVNPSLEGYWRMEPWFFGNILTLGIGGIVDMYYDTAIVLRSPFRVSLYPIGASEPTSPSTFHTASTQSQVLLQPPVNNGAIPDRLKHLKALKEQGLITEAEYEKKRAELIKDL